MATLKSNSQSFIMLCDAHTTQSDMNDQNSNFAPCILFLLLRIDNFILFYYKKRTRCRYLIVYMKKGRKKGYAKKTSWENIQFVMVYSKFPSSYNILYAT